MECKILMWDTKTIETKTIPKSVWDFIHRDRPENVTEEQYLFLRGNGLQPTIFNLNCLNYLNGVILTDAQVERWEKFGEKLDFENDPDLYGVEERLKVSRKIKAQAEQMEKLLLELRGALIQEKLREFENGKGEN